MPFIYWDHPTKGPFAARTIELKLNNIPIDCLTENVYSFGLSYHRQGFHANKVGVNNIYGGVSGYEFQISEYYGMAYLNHVGATNHLLLKEAIAQLIAKVNSRVTWVNNLL